MNKRFDNVEYEIIGLKPEPGSSNQHTIKERSAAKSTSEMQDKKSVFLSPLEFKKLSTAIIQDQYEKAALISVFIKPEYSFCLYIPENMVMADVLKLSPEIENRMKKNPESRPYHPISGRIYDAGQEIVNEECSLICFTESSYRAAPKQSVLFPFPYYNRRIGMRSGIETRREETSRETITSCNNCMACVRYCPEGLYPSHIYHYLVIGNTEEPMKLNIQACSHCRACGFVCPANLPIYETIVVSPQKSMAS